MPRYNEELERYILESFAVEDEALHSIRPDSVAAGLPEISIAPDEGRFLQLLCRLSGGREVCEIGTLGGYSTTWLARGLAPDGRLTSLELEEERAALARTHLERAGVDRRVEIVVGDARKTTTTVADRGPFDMVFIDADKTSYPDYFDWAFGVVRIGGLIAYHNALWENAKLTPESSPEARAVIGLSARIAVDSRLISTIYPAGGGTLVAVKVSDA